MKNKELEKSLQDIVPGTKLTSLIDFDLDAENKNLVMNITKRGLESNMQKDDGAFESWAIILKYHLSDLISTVIINWDDNETDVKNEHVSQFYYRLNRFLQTYTWATTARPIPTVPSLLLCHCPLKESAAKEDYPKGSEGELECEFVANNKSEFDCIDHQLPIGLFRDTVSKDTHYSPGNKSAIDIWAIKNDELYLFELKKPGNKPLGIISEIMYYTNVLNDLLSHRINYERLEESTNIKKAVQKNYRNFRVFYEAYMNGSIRRINSILLVREIHPLITEGLLDFVNESPRWKYLNIRFSSRTL